MQPPVFCDHRNRAFLRSQKPCYQQHKRRSEAAEPGVREALLSAYGRACLLCSKRLNTSTLHVDHAIPFARGGYDGMSNWIPLCGPCNKRKAANVVRGLVRERGVWRVTAAAPEGGARALFKATPKGEVYHAMNGCGRKTAVAISRVEICRRRLRACKVCALEIRV